MARGKKKGGRRRGGDSDSDDDGAAAAATATDATTTTTSEVAQSSEGVGGGKGGLSRKERRQQKLKEKQQAAAAQQQQGGGGGGGGGGKRGGGGGRRKGGGGRGGGDYSDDDDDDDDDGIANLIAGAKNAYGASSSDDDDGDGGEEAPPQPAVAAGKKAGNKKKKNKKKKGGGRSSQQDSDDDDDGIANLISGAKNAYGGGSSDDDEEEHEGSDEEDDEAPPQPVAVSKKKNKKKKRGKGSMKKGGGGGRASHGDSEEDEDAKEALFADDDDSAEEEDDEEEIVVPQPVKKLTKKQLKKQREREAAEEAARAALFEDSEDEEEEEEEEEEDLAAKMDDLKVDDEEEGSDDDGGRAGKKKKKKKDKKDKKKDKKDKSKSGNKDKAASEDGAEEDAAASAVAAAAGPGGDDEGEEELDDDEAKEKARKKAEKAARKAEKEAKKARKAEKEAKKAAKLAAKAAAAAAGEEGEEGKASKDDGEEEEEEEEGGIMYGAPDDHAWTDKSHAHREAEEKSKEGPDLSLIYGPDGKKLSNKERKRALKAKQAAERLKAYEANAAKASAEGAQFACSQTAINESDPQWQNSLDIVIPSFNISAAGKILFKDASLNISHGRRYGLVGANGRGKSTLLKMIASKDLKLPPRIDYLYVEQEVVADDTPAVDAVLKADKKRWDLMEEEKVLSKSIDGGDEDPEKVERLQHVFEELNAMGAEASEAKARRILYGLGFDVEMQTKPTKMFSGGWRMRISLARALFMEPTLLMLDEPTNHLDLNAVIWLDDYLQKWKKTLFIVSHDQDFLNSVTEEILHIEDLKLASYKGNYDSFKKAEATKLKQQQKAWEKQEKRLRELKRSGQSKAKATENVKKNAKREPGARAAKKKADAIASGSATAETQELIKRPREYTVKISFTEVAELTRPVMEVNRVHFRYSPKHPIIFEQIDFGIDMDSRICVVGPNGAGKSTLLKLLTGEIEATRGEVKRNPRLRMGIYNQHFVDRLPMSKTPVEHLRDRFDSEDYQSVRNRLGKYGLEGHAHEVAMRDLSGGQKARVVFVELSLQRPHILLLDEPTNNLDIETIDALIDAINNFNGGIVVVTHDQRLIDECDCTLWVVEKQGVTRWDAGFDDYKDTLLREMEEQAERDAASRKEKLEKAATERAEKLARLAAKLKR